jgi:O-antigen ligase
MRFIDHIHKYLAASVLLLAGLIILFVPQWVNDELLFPTQSGKFFLFAFSVFLLTLFCGGYISTSREISISITWTDILLALFVCYQILRTKYLTTIVFYEFAVLILFYIILRSINKEKIRYLLIFVLFAGGIQAVFGNLQLYGFYPSHHSLFKMTGSFFNPGPYAGYLVSVLPIAFGIYLFSKSDNKKIIWKVSNGQETSGSRISKIKHQAIALIKQLEPHLFIYISILTSIAILLVLPASKSRAAWLAAIASGGYLLFKHYKNRWLDILTYTKQQPLNKWALRLKRWSGSILNRSIAITLITIITCVIGYGLYNMKKGSADGRLLVWKVTSEMIKDKPLLGYGFNSFQAKYMEYQGKYFQSRPDSPEAMVADENRYAFNEPLRLFAETGFIGLILALYVIISIFLTVRPKERYDNLTSKTEPDYLTIASATIISIIVFGLFSYPAEILPIKINFVIVIAITSGIQKSIFNANPLATHSQYIVKPILLAIPLILLFPAIKELQKKQSAYQTWNEAHREYQMGIYKESTETYSSIYPELKNNGDFLINYGKALCMAEEHKNAIEILQEAKNHLQNTIIYTAMGDSYKALGETEKAEEAYKFASQIIPSVSSNFKPSFFRN